MDAFTFLLQEAWYRGQCLQFGEQQAYVLILAGCTAFTQYCFHEFYLPANTDYILTVISRNNVLIQESD